MGENLIGITIDDQRFKQGQAFVFSQASFRELLEKAVPVMEQYPDDFYLLRLSVNGWVLHVANRYDNTPQPSDSLVSYAVIAQCDEHGVITIMERT